VADKNCKRKTTKILKQSTWYVNCKSRDTSYQRSTTSCSIHRFFL